ncbi:MAG TPA: biopolymer transporter ExbD [Planctomycetaceae bacterium]|nr:biopolymer transporter ExbD [Planctomycetaceae bacterium]
MPILFRCPSCNQKLSITRKRAGTMIACPKCKEQTLVPTLDEIEAAATRISAEEVDPEAAEESFSDDFAAEAENGFRSPEPVFETARQTEWKPRADASHDDDDDDDDDEPDFAIRKAQTEFEEMDLTPMVDVTFLLLIFFMITASFSLQKVIPTPVPDPNESSASQPIQQQEDILDKSIMIEIDNDNKIRLDDEPIPDENMFPDRLQQAMSKDKKSEILVTVADKALQGTVVFVLDTANELNVSKIRLAAKSGGDD